MNIDPSQIADWWIGKPGAIPNPPMARVISELCEKQGITSPNTFISWLYEAGEEGPFGALFGPKHQSRAKLVCAAPATNYALRHLLTESQQIAQHIQNGHDLGAILMDFFVARQVASKALEMASDQ